MSKYQGDTIEHTLKGIPCLIGVDTYIHQAPFKGSAHNCWSDNDYYGYTDIEFTILDRKGYPAKWLAKKLTTKDEEEIESLIMEHYSDDGYL